MMLGNTMEDNLSWDNRVRMNVIPALRNQVSTLRNMSKYLDRGFRANYANAVFKSKLMFGLKSWGAQKTLLAKIQSLQDQASKLAILVAKRNKSSRQRREILGWLTIEGEIRRATFLQTY